MYFLGVYINLPIVFREYSTEYPRIREMHSVIM